MKKPRVRIQEEFLFDTADVGQEATSKTLEGLYHMKKLADLMAPDPREWEYRGDVSDAGASLAKCSCGHPIRYVFTIWNKTDGRGLPIGSVCIETSVPALISQGADALANALTAAVEKLKAQIEEAKKRERDALNDTTAYALAKEYEELLAWCFKAREGLRRAGFGWVPPFLYRLPNKPKPCTSPGRTVASLASKYATLWIDAQTWFRFHIREDVRARSGVTALPPVEHSRLKESLRAKLSKELGMHKDYLRRTDEQFPEGKVPQFAERSVKHHSDGLNRMNDLLTQVGAAQ